MIALEFDRYVFRLGDCSGALYLLENLGRQTGITSKVKGGYVKNLFDLLEFEYVQLDGEANYIHPIQLCTKELQAHKIKYHNNNKNAHWLPCLKEYFENRHSFSTPDAFPLRSKLEPMTSKKSYLQLDGRCARRRNCRLTNQEMILISRWCLNIPVILGGPDTEHYLDGFAYEIGDLTFLTRSLLGCFEFVGVDSGLSHLAGSLGVPSKIVIQWKEIEPIANYYQVYPHTVTSPRLFGKVTYN